MSTVTRRALTAWLLNHGFTELGGKATSHRRFRHESGVVITVPGHGRQNLSQKHIGMIVRQLEAAGFDRDTVRRDLTLGSCDDRVVANAVARSEGEKTRMR